MFALALQLDDFFLGKQIITAIGSHLIELFESLHGFLYSDPIGQEPAQPALVDVEHPTTLRFFRDRILRLPLGTHEKHRLSSGGQVGHELRRFLEHLERLLQIDDVNPVALTEDVFLHLRIPALRLMPEVNTRFEQLLHGDVSQKTSYLVCIKRPSFNVSKCQSFKVFETLKL